jgi:hypothetical protein
MKPKEEEELKQAPSPRFYSGKRKMVKIMNETSNIS